MTSTAHVMQRRSAVLFLFALLSFPIFCETVELEEDTDFYIQGRNVKLKGGTSVDLDDSGFVHWGTLAGPTYLKVQGKEVLFANTDYPNDTTWFHQGEKLMRGVLAEDTILRAAGRDVTLKAGSSVSFYEDESIFTCFLARGNYFPIEGQNVELINGTIVHENGKIGHSVLARDLTIQVSGKDVTFYDSVSFLEDGSLKGGYLRNDVTLDVQGREVHFRKGDTLFLHENGAVAVGRIAGPVNLEVGDREILFQEGYTHFYPNGNVASGYLAKDTPFVIQGKSVKLKSNKSASFFSDGSLSSGVLAENTKLLFKGRQLIPGGAMTFSEGEIIELNEHGEVARSYREGETGR